MTTAKQPQVNNQPDAADDLIAELAKLMAQDAQGESPQPKPASPAPRPVPPMVTPSQPSSPRPAIADGNRPSTPSGSAFAFRLPGDSAAPRPVPPIAPVVAPQQREPVLPVQSMQRPVEPRVMPVVPQPRQAPPAPMRREPNAPFSAEFAPSRPTPRDPVVANASQPSGIDSDALADLIAAELAADDAPDTTITFEDDDTRNSEGPFDAVEPPERTQSADSFKVAPVFGMPGPVVARVEPPAQWRPAPAVSAQRPREDIAERTPIEDIEDLIGDAAYVQPQQQAPSPALRSLATPVLPVARPPAGRRTQTDASEVEEAILAAAAATGAKVGWIDPQIDDQLDGDYDEDEPVYAERRRRGVSMRGVVAPLAAVAVLIAAGFGLYTVLGMGGTDGPAPVLTADATPVKETPEPTTETAAPSSVVFDEIAGESTPAEEEELVSRDQSEATEVAALPVATDPNSEEGLVNRRVRTVTVRPDGTIVSGEDAVAGAAQLPVDRPNVPDLPGTDTSDPLSSLIAETDAATPASDAAGAVATGGTSGATALDGTTPADGTAASTAVAAVDPAEVLIPGQPATAVDAAGNVLAGRTVPVPMPRIERSSAPSTISSQASAPVNAIITPPATTTPVTQPLATSQPAVATAAPASQAPAYVQLSSQRSEEAARQTAQDVQNRFGTLFGGAQLEVQRVDLGAQGVYYRVRLPAQSAQSASQICNSVLSAGGDCFTL